MQASVKPQPLPFSHLYCMLICLAMFCREDLLFPHALGFLLGKFPIQAGHISRCFTNVIVAHMSHEAALFQNIFKFCSYIFAQIFKYFATNFCPFYHFSEKLHTWPNFLEQALLGASMQQLGQGCSDNIFSNQQIYLSKYSK